MVYNNAEEEVVDTVEIQGDDPVHSFQGGSAIQPQGESIGYVRTQALDPYSVFEQTTDFLVIRPTVLEMTATPPTVGCLSGIPLPSPDREVSKRSLCIPVSHA